MRLLLVLVLLCALALSCQSAGPAVTTLPPASAPQGRCPDAPRLLVVAQLQPQEDGPRIPVVYEHLRWLEEGELSDGNWDIPIEFHDLQPGEPLPEDVTHSDDPVWVLSDAAPCRMAAGARMRVRLSLGGPPYEVLVRRLEGPCALPKAPTVALQQAADPGSCRYASMTHLDDPQAAPFPLPDEAARALSPDTCAPPRCYMDRQFQADELSDGAQVVGVTGVRYDLDANDQPDCGTVDLISMAWFRLRPDAPWQEWPWGYDGRHLLYDDRGLRALAHQFYGFLQLDAPTSPEVTPLFESRWAIYHEEDSNSGLNPCGP
jgi:hypothetical protein